jgi:hypothetical protein
MMRNRDRVVFFSERDLAGGFELRKGEHILRAVTKSDYTDINDILELLHLKKYIDNEVYLKKWTREEIVEFKQKVVEYENIIGRFMATITDKNIELQYDKLIFDYKNSFWELVNSQSIYKKISQDVFRRILDSDRLILYRILPQKRIVEHYSNPIKDFMSSHPESAEIILSKYEIAGRERVPYFLPPSLTITDKENIILKYIDLPQANLNYLQIIPNVRNNSVFRLTDKTRLKAQKKCDTLTEKFFSENNSINYKLAISFPENMDTIKEGHISDGTTLNYSYSLDFIKQNNNPHALFENFIYLFEYVDHQNRIDLASKRSDFDVLERHIGLHSHHDYLNSFKFRTLEKVSLGQIAGYSKVLEEMGVLLEKTLSQVFTVIFPENYGFASNSRLIISTASNLLEKVRLLAPELESILKQYKLFVEDGSIDFDLLQISSQPTLIKDIPSLNKDKYLYLNEKNSEIKSISNIFFSDQTLLSYVEPFKGKKYKTFFDLLANEENVEYYNYQDHKKTLLQYLLDRDQIYIDKKGCIQITNLSRILILYDLNLNEVASFYHYPQRFRQEVTQMAKENIIHFENTLFSKPEQDYFNYYLNKSMFTNGLDLRNKYLHGTQANPEDEGCHKYAYYTYLKLIVLALLKIEDDLIIHKALITE